MSRNTRLLIDLVSAGGFYYFFGVLVLSLPGNQAYASIVPAIHLVVVVIAVALVALAVRRYLNSGLRSDQTPNPVELSRREVVARKHISAAYGKPGSEYGVTLFVSHHLAEIDAKYWVNHTGAGEPEPQQVLDILELRLDPEEDMDTLDFTLPDNVTNYVVCVGFDDSGKVVSVEMES